MFSQYSWWDFIKFILILAVPYYAFVLWKYYQEDIRKLISNRGKTPQAASAESSDEDEEEVEDTDLYSVKTYSDAVADTNVEPEQKPQPSTLPSNKTAEERQSVYQRHDVDIPEGVLVNDDSANTFEMAIVAEVVRPTERSLSEVINAARRVTADQTGALSANDPNDTDASEVATLINEQKGFNSLLSGVSFNR
jgi:hypothetical protein